ncbi:MAG TPA: TM0106 family RecB-like putative nuclease [Vicinamibacterales bacterium]|nr:TM0106 family RecB-like putative nuclease [Vicinamibacterales bacterium]
MRLVNGQLLIAPTDLSTFISCRHRTGLDLAVAHGVLHRPVDDNSFAAILRHKGEEHERRYVDSLRARGLHVAVVEHLDGRAESLARQTDETIAAMRRGADAIVQARLAYGNTAGYADVLLKVDRESRLGTWSYEPQDTKLARETKGSAILQLCGYAELLEQMQGVLPELFHIVTPDKEHPVQSYRTTDYLAYYRSVRDSLQAAIAMGHDAIRETQYPEPVEYCAVCAWEGQCLARRRRDDHLSFIANSGRLHRHELSTRGYGTLTAAATMPVPVPFTPSRGAREAYDRLGHQARLQHQQRREGRPIFERLSVTAGEGLTRLPEPSVGDVFLDLEGARFAREGGREFLFGLWMEGTYHACWATDDAAEKRAFEETVDRIMSSWAAHPMMHVYHFNHYEPTAFKKLVGRHVTRAEALDQLLRAERFVDLYTIVRQAVRCGVESYSIKRLEQYYGFERRVGLANAAHPLAAVELALDAQAPESITSHIRDAVQGYNEDDCRSTEGLRNWLETVRAEAADAGDNVPRPAPADGDASPAVSALQQEVNALRAQLLEGLPPEAGDPSHPDHARWLLAYLIDWHRREENAQWWAYFELKDLPEEELLDESRALAGLQFVERITTVTNKKTGKPTGSVVDRYAYPSQEVEIRRKGKLKLQDGRGFGEVERLDRASRLVDVRKGPSVADVHPSAVFVADVIPTETAQRSVMRLATRLVDGDASGCGLELLRRQPPRLRSAHFEPQEGERATDFAVRIATDLNATTLPIQGPPGAGKTFAGAQMIRALVRARRRVGVTANSHKVIRNLLDAVAAQAAAAGETVRLAAKVNEAAEQPGGVREIENNEEAIAALGTDVDVLGGTAWLWSRPEAAGSVDVLFVDEAGQMSLANGLAVSHAADSLVLLGDPRQLDQPQQAAHPDGVGISALAHVLGSAETMPQDRGIFLPVTHRMAPAITRFTSEVFYAGKLEAKPALHHQALAGTPYDGAGLWLVPVDHDANQTVSGEEVEAVAELVGSLLDGEWTLTPPSQAPETRPQAPSWIDEQGASHRLTGRDIKVVAPFNAQVNRLSERLAEFAIEVGTVDRFQGQEAAIVIYSMTTSDPDDAPRGMEFLYSLNRLNVATSRARCAVFVVCSPRLLQPDCRTPRQMQLANALCRYRELAR